MNIQEMMKEISRELEHAETQMQDMRDAMGVTINNLAQLRGVHSEVINLKRDLPIKSDKA